MLEEENEFIPIDVGIVILIEVLESLADCAPLLSDLEYKSVHKVTIVNDCLSSCLLVVTLRQLLVLQVLILRRVALRVVSKNETRKVVNHVTNPSAKVCVVQATRTVCTRVMCLQNFNQVGIVDRYMGPVE